MIPHSRPALGKQEKDACLKVLDSLHIAQGEKVEEFEALFCRTTERRYAIAVSSGTAALHLALLGLEISQADEVLCPSFTCVALLHALDAVGAKPVLVDIDLQDFNISVSELKRKISRKTKAVIVPHAFGRPAKIDEITGLGIRVLEDGTQALGAKVGGKPVGSFGELSVFSFYATKMITTGEGGMVLTDSEGLARKIVDLRDYDKKDTYRFRTNSKMTDLEAAIGIEQIKKLPFFIERRHAIASSYRSAFEGFGGFLPLEDSLRSHIYYRYVVRFTEENGEWLTHFQSRGIDAKEPVFKPLHRYLNLPDELFPATVHAFKRTCSLPIYPSLSDEDCEQICCVIQEKVHSGLSVKKPCFHE
jgi:perosamine synthetase